VPVDLVAQCRRWCVCFTKPGTCCHLKRQASLWLGKAFLEDVFPETVDESALEQQLLLSGNVISRYSRLQAATFGDAVRSSLLLTLIRLVVSQTLLTDPRMSFLQVNHGRMHEDELPAARWQQIYTCSSLDTCNAATYLVPFHFLNIQCKAARNAPMQSLQSIMSK